MNHRLTRARNGIAWPSFTGTATLVGTSASGVTVYYDASLGAQALQNANDLLADADRVVAFNNATFATTGKPVNVIIFALGGVTDGTGGADHAACDYVTGQNIEVCASFGNSARVSALFEAELSECAMNGQLCGMSTGEALSRFLAMAVSNNALADFATAPQWAADGYANFVDSTEATDQDPDANGCGLAFISWLASQGFTVPQVAQAMVALGDNGTLANLYKKVTGSTAAPWPLFLSAARALTITSDDPFGALNKPAPVPAPIPAPIPVPVPAPVPTPAPPPVPVPPPPPAPEPVPTPHPHHHPEPHGRHEPEHREPEHHHHHWGDRDDGSDIG